jgi:hypothetical protein
MAITLRNKPVEEMIRRIGAQTGEGPSAVIARVIVKETERLEAERKAAAAEKLAKLQAIRAQFPPFTDDERKEAWALLDRINEEMFEDKPHEDQSS